MSEEGFQINKAYADKYNRWREKEELQKLKDKYGDVGTDGVSSSSESEDEDAEALTASVEKGWLRALAAIKSRDPKIYDSSANFYDNEDPGEGTSSSKKKQSKIKPMFLKDYDRKVILEKGGMLSDESEDEDAEEQYRRMNDPSYFEEQENIRKSINEAVEGSDSEDEFLTKRTKTEEEKEIEENDYLEWLKGQNTELSEKAVGIELKPLKNYWGNPKLAEDEKFMRDFILNKQYLEENDDRIPSYHEIVEEEDMSEEEKELEKQEEFERKYNFRFEEPDPEFIKSYPRTMGDSVRKKKDKRAKKRAEIKERKQKEKEKKMEELKQLKNLKKREILSKLDRLKEVTGNPDVGITADDIEEDFDPSKHDKLMEQVFNEDYYEDEDDHKPLFSDDEELGIEAGWDNWAGPSSQTGDGNVEDDEQQDEDGGVFQMDAEFDPDQEDRCYGLDGRSKKKKKSKFALAVERRKPLFNPAEKTFEEYFDEYYKLDYEDIVADQPCRFKYRPVPANNFGLTTDEILACRDKELNAWVSLKKMSQYRTEEEEEYDKRAYHRRSKNPRKKTTILTSLVEEPEVEEDQATPSKPSKKRKRKKHTADSSQVPFSDDPVHKRNKQKAENTDSKSHKTKKRKQSSIPDSDILHKKSKDTVASSGITHKQLPSEKKKKKLKKKKSHIIGVGAKGFKVSEERLKAYGINPKKFKYTHLNKTTSSETPS